MISRRLLHRVHKPIERLAAWYLVIYAFVAAGVMYLSWHARGMAGILPCYEDFRDIVLAGFDPSAVPAATPTFPMWGYGWLMLVSNDQLYLLATQNLLALIAVAVWIRHLQSERIVGPGSLAWLKVAIALSLPWHAFHSLRWPYSFAVSLILLSLVTLHRAGLNRNAARNLAVSAASFGLALNFRSDYCLLPWALAGVMVYCARDRRSLRRAAAWVAIVYSSLIPWMLYSHRATGHVLLTSTNSGHVLFIGLGQLPDNPWGIEPHDGCPEMRRRIRDHFGRDQSSLVYESDVFLRQEFLQCVREHPEAYLRKCCYGWLLSLNCYSGEFLAGPDGDLIDPNAHALRNNTLAGFLHKAWASPGPLLFRRAVQVASILTGLVVVWTGLACAVLLGIFALRKRQQFPLLIAAVVGYQFALCTAAYAMHSYTSNVYLLLLTSLFVVARQASVKATEVGLMTCAMLVAGTSAP